MPGEREEGGRAALPRLSGAVPRTAEPFLKVMSSPLGGVLAADVTEAVNVTVCPEAEGFSEEVTVVVVWLPVLFSRTPTTPSADVSQIPASCGAQFATRMSGRPSPLTSARATPMEFQPPES